MIAGRNVIGAVQLDSRERIGAFVTKDLHMVMAVANQIAIHVENRALLRRVESETKMREQLDRFLPPQVVQKIVCGEGEIQRGGSWARRRLVRADVARLIGLPDAGGAGREIVGTVVFADIRGFTRMTENASGPQEIVDILNEYFERVRPGAPRHVVRPSSSARVLWAAARQLVSIVFKRQGVLDKYIGDALMALFGTLPSETDPVFNAVATAIEFRDAMRAMNTERAAAGQMLIGVGVGVCTGPLIAGFIGCVQVRSDASAGRAAMRRRA